MEMYPQQHMLSQWMGNTEWEVNQVCIVSKLGAQWEL